MRAERSRRRRRAAGSRRARRLRGCRCRSRLSPPSVASSRSVSTPSAYSVAAAGSLQRRMAASWLVVGVAIVSWSRSPRSWISGRVRVEEEAAVCSHRARMSVEVIRAHTRPFMNRSSALRVTVGCFASHLSVALWACHMCASMSANTARGKDKAALARASHGEPAGPSLRAGIGERFRLPATDGDRDAGPPASVQRLVGRVARAGGIEDQPYLSSTGGPSEPDDLLDGAGREQVGPYKSTSEICSAAARSSRSACAATSASQAWMGACRAHGARPARDGRPICGGTGWQTTTPCPGRAAPATGHRPWLDVRVQHRIGGGGESFGLTENRGGDRPREGLRPG